MFDAIRRFVIYWQALFVLAFFGTLVGSFVIEQIRLPEELKKGTLGAIGRLKEDLLGVQADLQWQLDMTNQKIDGYNNSTLYNIGDIRTHVNLPPEPPPQTRKPAISSPEHSL